MTQKEIFDVHRNNNCKMNMMEPNLSKYQFIFSFQMKINNGQKIIFSFSKKSKMKHFVLSKFISYAIFILKRTDDEFNEIVKFIHIF